MKYLLFIVLLLLTSPKAFAQKVVLKPWDPGYSLVNYYYKNLPRKWKIKNDLLLVYCVDSSEFKAANEKLYPSFAKKLPEPGGEYFKGDPSIILINSESLNKTSQKIFDHEYGHHIFMSVMTKEEQEDWINLWALCKSKQLLPSDYAFSNANEGFAECFKFYIEDLKLDKSVKEFISRIKNRIKDNHASL